MTAQAKADYSAILAALLPTYAKEADRQTMVLCLADTLACALGAEAVADEHGGTVERIRKLPQTGLPQATIWATGQKTDVDTAALRNAVAARYLDFNDTFVGRAIIHPSDVLAALIALAEERQIGWDQLIEAACVAYEVLCRLAEKVDLRSHGFDGSTLSPIGTAAGAAWLLGLDEQTTAQALRIAALDAGTLRAVRQGRLSDWKAIASGRGAVKGLFAVRMAEAGCIAPDSVFDGSEGLFSVVTGEVDIDAEGEARLKRVILKAYPAQIFIQGLLQLALELKPQLPSDLNHIQSIQIHTFKMAVEMVGGHGAGPAASMNRETADHSAAFAVSAIFHEGKLAHDMFDQLLKEPDILSLIQKSSVLEDIEATAQFPSLFKSRITVSLEDGTVLMAEQSQPKALQSADLATKFQELWPEQKPKSWCWALPGTAPQFPVATTE